MVPGPSIAPVYFNAIKGFLVTSFVPNSKSVNITLKADGKTSVRDAISKNLTVCLGQVDHGDDT